MDFSTVKSLVTSKTARTVLLTKKHSPAILFTAGTVGFVATTVLAARATLKVGPALELHEAQKKNIENLVRADAGVQFAEPGYLTAEQAVEETKKLKLKTAINIAKPYLPAIGVGLVSIAALTGSHVILTKRNSAIGAAFLALDVANRKYRENVVAEYGVDVDRKFSSTEQVLVEEKLADGTTVTKTEATKKTNGKSPYTHVFDETSRYFSKMPGMNATTLQMKQSELNDKLRAQGHLTLNDALRRLGLPITPEGFQVGWVFKPNDPNHKGDNFVDFGVFNGDEELVESFFDGEYYWAVLNFNCDPGLIYQNV